MVFLFLDACRFEPPSVTPQDPGSSWSVLAPDSGIGGDSGPPDSGAPDSGLPDSGSPPDSGDPHDTAPEIVYDCAALSPTAIEDNELGEPIGYHDVAFDDAGYLYGWDTRTSLMRSTRDNGISVFAPGFDNAQGIARLPSGDLAVGDSDTGTLWRVSPAGAKSVLASDLSDIYGVMVGPDGNLYVGSQSDIYRVDADTGAKKSLIHLDNSAQARAAAFSPDNRTLYVATVGRGRVYQVPLDENLDATGTATVLVERTNGRWHDAIGVDACGNVYVAEYYSAGLYRITPEGTMTTLYSGKEQLYGHGFEWGSGVGGWRADALYLAQPYDGNSIRELVIGVPSADSVRVFP